MIFPMKNVSQRRQIGSECHLPQIAHQPNACLVEQLFDQWDYCFWDTMLADPIMSMN